MNLTLFEWNVMYERSIWSWDFVWSENLARNLAPFMSLLLNEFPAKTCNHLFEPIMCKAHIIFSNLYWEAIGTLNCDVTWYIKIELLWCKMMNANRNSFGQNQWHGDRGRSFIHIYCPVYCCILPLNHTQACHWFKFLYFEFCKLIKAG